MNSDAAISGQLSGRGDASLRVVATLPSAPADDLESAQRIWDLRNASRLDGESSAFGSQLNADRSNENNMNLTGLHFLLSYRCTHECDHCFVWSSPRARGTMTLTQVQNLLHQAKELDTIERVYFEGGEPFLFYPILIRALREAASLGLETGVVSNCYWATSVEDAVEWLRPMAEIGIADLSLSSDVFHGEARLTQAASNALEAARRLALPEGIISVDPPAACEAYPTGAEGEPAGSRVRFRGRATATLTEGVPCRPWREFTTCPDEDLTEPGRLHVDAFGHLHICQGIVIGNVWRQPLKEIVAGYDPASHPIIGPLSEGGPAALAQRYGLPADAEIFADACHLCYLARETLRSRFPEFLTPDQMYGTSAEPSEGEAENRSQAAPREIPVTEE